MPPFVHRITKYDPADRDEHGHYHGIEEPTGDHGAVESAYLQAVAAFAAASGIDRLTIREPQIAGVAHFGPETAVEGHGLNGLFPPDLSGFHDGAEISLSVGLELVRAMLRDNGAWCRLEVENRFAVHVGWDQYVYVNSDKPCKGALARTRALGLFPERLQASHRARPSRCCMPSGVACPAHSAMLQQFFRGRSDSSPSTKSLTRRRGSTRANRTAIRLIRTSNASCQRAGSTLWPAATARSLVFTHR